MILQVSGLNERSISLEQSTSVSLSQPQFEIGMAYIVIWKIYGFKRNAGRSVKSPNEAECGILLKKLIVSSFRQFQPKVLVSQKMIWIVNRFERTASACQTWNLSKSCVMSSQFIVRTDFIDAKQGEPMTDVLSRIVRRFERDKFLAVTYL
jgi:hypothetical protein